jgi:O-antigen polysaccharide polymerase Wzy
VSAPALPSRAAAVSGARPAVPPALWYGLTAYGAAIASVTAEGVQSRAAMLGTLLVAAAIVIAYVVHRYRANGGFVLEPLLLLVVAFFVWHFAFWVVYFLGFSSWYRVDLYFAIAPDLMLSGLLVCVAGLAALVAGIVAGTRSVRVQPRPPSHLASPALVAIALGGAALVVLYFFVRGQELFGRYEALFVEEDPLRRAYNLGVTLVLASVVPLLYLGRSRLHQWVVVAAAALPVIVVSTYVGSRWILFTLAALVLCATSMTGRRIGWLRVAAVTLVLVPAAIVVKEVRSGNVDSPGDVRPLLLDRHTNPLIELPEELGQAFIPVVGTMQMRREGEAYLLGASYGGAALSTFPSLTHLLDVDVPRPGHELAERLFLSRYTLEGYTVGHSIVAELYRNFGIIGVVVGLTLLGYGLGRLFRRVVESESFATLFVFFALVAILMFGLRNDSFTWLRSAVWACALLLLVGRGLDRRHGRRAEET